jgi:hypothetical protein
MLWVQVSASLVAEQGAREMKRHIPLVMVDQRDDQAALEDGEAAGRPGEWSQCWPCDDGGEAAGSTGEWSERWTVTESGTRK